MVAAQLDLLPFLILRQALLAAAQLDPLPLCRMILRLFYSVDAPQNI